MIVFGILESFIPTALIALIIIIVLRLFIFNNSNNKHKTEPTIEDDSSKFDNQMDNENKVFEQAVANVDDLKNGEMKEVAMGKGKVLLVKENNEIQAIGHKCTHYGAPLIKGALCNGRIRCPWHGACFSTKTGDIEDFPGLDSIHKFPLKIEDGKVIVSATEAQLRSKWRRKPTLKKRSKNNDTLVAIVGAGPAGVTCAETLRKEGFDGRVMIIGKEKHLPYDRTKFSKSMSLSVDRTLLRPQEWYDDNDIEVILGNGAKQLDPQQKTIVLEDDKVVNYDQVFIATGGNPRKVPIKGLETVGNVHFLRVAEEANTIVKGAENANVVIIGSSFIGMEVAAYVSKSAKKVSIIGMEKVPFERVLGEKLGAALQKWHDFKSKQKIEWHMNSLVSEIIAGKDGNVEFIQLKSGEKLPCDICVVGAGVVPATDFIKQNAGVKIKEREKSVLVDKYLKAGDSVYAGGDIARYDFHFSGESVRIEHYGVAQYHGKIAALNILGKKVECKTIPFFWTAQYGKSLRYCGHALHFDDVIIDGSLDAQNFKFVAYYCDGDKVVAAASMDRDPAVSIVAELLHNNKMLTKTQLQNQLKQGSIKLYGKL